MITKLEICVTLVIKKNILGLEKKEERVKLIRKKFNEKDSKKYEERTDFNKKTGKKIKERQMEK